MAVGAGALGDCETTPPASPSETAGPALQSVYSVQHRVALPEAIIREFRWLLRLDVAHFFVRICITINYKRASLFRGKAQQNTRILRAGKLLHGYQTSAYSLWDIAP